MKVSKFRMSITKNMVLIGQKFQVRPSHPLILIPTNVHQWKIKIPWLRMKGKIGHDDVV
jgi:hypothetical protein